MKRLGILTSDFRIYYELIKELKKRGLEFKSLSFSEPIPMNIGVIITTEEEMDKIDFPKLIATTNDIDLTIDIAQRTLKGKEAYHKMIIGIDPGKRPGIAIIGDDGTCYPEDVGLALIVDYSFKQYHQAGKLFFYSIQSLQVLK